MGLPLFRVNFSRTHQVPPAARRSSASAGTSGSSQRKQSAGLRSTILSAFVYRDDVRPGSVRSVKPDGPENPGDPEPVVASGFLGPGEAPSGPCAWLSAGTVIRRTRPRAPRSAGPARTFAPFSPRRLNNGLPPHPATTTAAGPARPRPNPSSLGYRGREQWRPAR